MKKFFIFLSNSIVIFALVFGLFYYREDIGTSVDLFRKYLSPCQKPVAYSLGEFDKRFGISEEDFLKMVDQAAEIWGDSIDKKLFVYSPDGILKINLVYDYRQESTAKLQKLGVVINNDQESYDETKNKYDALNKIYLQEKAIFEKAVSAFESEKKSYEAQVEHWNGRGGSPKEVYEKLEKDRIALNNEKARLDQLQARLNGLVEDLNTLAPVLNQMIKKLNLTVNNYNTIGVKMGEEFQAGEYVRRGVSEEINIYQFENREKLIRLLAHEFGHALQLEHIENPKAIMYRLNEGVNEELTRDDISLLQVICRNKDKFSLKPYLDYFRISY